MGKRDKRVAWVNPIALARSTGPKEATGTTIRDYLDRSRPTLEEVTEKIKKAREGSHALANWEEQQQKKFSRELAAQRAAVLGEGSSQRSSKKKRKKEKRKFSKRKKHRARSRSPLYDSSSDKDKEEIKRVKKKKHHRKQETSSDSEDNDTTSDDSHSPEYRETLYLQFIDVLVHGEQTEPNPIFVAFFKFQRQSTRSREGGKVTVTHHSK
ncbi:protein FAM133-like isoform X1 [Dysidea avara]|uniref:protein FAM133-like isoform X1 n=1 Tax=Dysidea avara TaxID=196820 RepID=UPI00332D2FFD